MFYLLFKCARTGKPRRGDKTTGRRWSDSGTPVNGTIANGKPRRGDKTTGGRWSGSATPVNGTIANGEPRRGDGHYQPPAMFPPAARTLHFPALLCCPAVRGCAI